MDVRGLAFLCILLVVVLGQAELSHAETLPMELHWRSVLPNTPMPDVIRAKLHQDLSADVRLKEKLEDTFPLYSENTANEYHLPRNVNLSFFFFKKDLHPGAQLKMLFTKPTSGPSFLPRSVAEVMLFSTAKMSEILQLFSIDPNSEEAKIMKRTVISCESPGLKDEAKYCATSLDSMIDFTTSKLGTSVSVHSTMVEKETHEQLYTIAPGLHQLASSNVVACHAQTYKYAVHICHELADTSAYVVPLVGEDRTRVKAIVVCHEDTSEWDPNHLALQLLHLKPGSDPVCHFNPEGHLIWVKN